MLPSLAHEEYIRECTLCIHTSMYMCLHFHFFMYVVQYVIIAA